MKKLIIIILLILTAGVVYAFTRPSGIQATVYESNSQSQAANLSEPNVEQITKPMPSTNASQPNSGNLSPETGWSAFPGITEPQPQIDVSAQINIGNGSPEPKTITAKQGQRVSIAFTSAIRDQVVIEGYNYDTYVEPQRDSTLGFQVNTKGQFTIKLVKLNKTIGILVVK